MQLGPHSRRAQSSGFIVFFLILAVGALLWGLLDIGMAQIFTSTLAQTDKTQAEAVINTRKNIWQNLLFFVLAFAAVLIIARATIQSTQ